MQNGFFGVVNGFYTVPDCVMLDCGREVPEECEGELMRSYCGKKVFCLVKEEDACNKNGTQVCRCHVLRLFGIGLVGGGVLCRIMRALGKAGICFYGASVSECGIALALPRESFSDALRILSAELLEEERT